MADDKLKILYLMKILLDERVICRLRSNAPCSVVFDDSLNHFCP